MECDFEKRCTEHAEANGWMVLKVKAVGVTGLPDRLYMKDGVVIFIEFKDPDGNYSVSKRQALMMRKLRRAGVEAYACDDWDQFLEILSRGLDAESL